MIAQRIQFPSQIHKLQLKAILTYSKPTSGDEEERREKTVTVEAGTNVTFGRDNSATVSLIDPWISNSHIMFEVDEAAAKLKVHTKGRNGAWMVRQGIEQLVKAETTSSVSGDTWYLRGSGGNYRIEVMLGGQAEGIENIKAKLADTILTIRDKVDKLNRENTKLYSQCLTKSTTNELERKGNFATDELESEQRKQDRELQEAKTRVMEMERMLVQRKIYWAKQMEELQKGTLAKGADDSLACNKRLRAEKDEMMLKVRKLHGVADPTKKILGVEWVDSDHFLSYEDMCQREEKLDIEAAEAQRLAELQAREKKELRALKAIEGAQALTNEPLTTAATTLPLSLPCPPVTSSDISGELKTTDGCPTSSQEKKKIQAEPLLTLPQPGEVQNIFDSSEEDFDMGDGATSAAAAAAKKITIN